VRKRLESTKVVYILTERKKRFRGEKTVKYVRREETEETVMKLCKF
jgi:hypothetical protein